MFPKNAVISGSGESVSAPDLQQSAVIASPPAHLKNTVMHTPNPGSDPRPESDQDDVHTPTVPPDQEDDLVPIEEPPKPGRSDSPMIAVPAAPSHGVLRELRSRDGAPD